MPDLSDPSLDLNGLIEALGLSPHPEGGYYRETWRDTPTAGGRGAGTAILFLLKAGEVSHWHRVDASELWIWQAGAPLGLSLSATGEGADLLRLGPDLGQGEALHGLVPPGYWQSARSLGPWTLVSCVVAPAFSFAGFELAPPGWGPTALA